MTHATVMAVMWLRGEDDELLPEWQNRAACTWAILNGREWGRFAAIQFAAGDVELATPADLCPCCAVLVDVARALGVRPHVTV